MKTTIVAVLAAVGGIVGVCTAQPQAGGAGPTPQGEAINPESPNPWRFRLDLGGRYEFESDFRNAPGNSQAWRAGAELSIGYVPDSQWRVGLDLGLEESWYDFNGATTLAPGGDPMGATTRLELGPTVGYQIDEHWGLLAGGLVGLSFENGADVGKSFTAGGLVGARYRFSDDFTLTFGVMGRTQLEDDFYFMPFIGFEWQVTPEVNLSTRGIGLELTAKVAEQWSVIIAGVYETREYRLDDSGAVPGGVGRDRRLPLVIGVVYSPTKNIDLRLEGGAVLWQQYTIDNAAGVRVGREEGRIAPMIGLRATFRF